MADLALLEERTRKKRALRAGFVIPVLAFSAIVVIAAASLMSAIVSDGERLEIFTAAAEIPPELAASTIWLPDPDGLPRAMEPLTRDDITATWIRAWEQLEIVSRTGDTAGVEVYFANSAQESVLRNAPLWDGRSVSQLGHTLELTFYSEDGQVIGLQSKESRLLRSESTEAGSFIRNTREGYEAVLVLEDGSWRIHHWVRRSFEADAWTISRAE